MITFEINGIRYEQVLEANFTESMTEFTNEASFKVALDGTEDAPFAVNSSCVVYLDDTKVMTGYIYDAILSYNSSSHDLTYVVRDKTADFSDSDIDAIGALSGSLSLKAIIESIVSHIGTSLSVSNDVGDLKNFSIDNDDIKPDFGQNCFDYVEGLARKRQVLLTTNPNGEISIIRNSGNLMSGKIQNSIKNIDENNIIDAKFSISNSSTHNKYVIRSQLGSASSKSDFGFGSSNKESTNQVGEFINDTVRKGRQRCLLAEESSTSSVNLNRAEWQNNFAKTESQKYSVTINNHSISGEIFKSNNLIQVIDDFSRINDNMLIKSVSCSYSNESGSLTTLDLVDKNAFLVLTEVQFESVESKKKKNIFSGV